jgi:hypothetical protein
VAAKQKDVEMKIIKVAEATNTQLDWLVAKALGIEVKQGASGVLYCISTDIPNVYSPTQYWAQGGPLIGQKQILFRSAGSGAGLFAYFRRFGTEGCSASGPDHLVAAIRLVVKAELGDEVEVPKELL